MTWSHCAAVTLLFKTNEATETEGLIYRDSFHKHIPVHIICTYGNDTEVPFSVTSDGGDVLGPTRIPTGPLYEMSRVHVFSRVRLRQSKPKAESFRHSCIPSFSSSPIVSTDEHWCPSPCPQFRLFLICTASLSPSTTFILHKDGSI